MVSGDFLPDSPAPTRSERRRTPVRRARVTARSGNTGYHTTRTPLVAL